MTWPPSAPGAPRSNLLDNITRGLLRHADAAQPGGDPARARAEPDHDPALGHRRRSAPSRRRSARSDLGLNPSNDGKLIRVPDSRRSPRSAARRSSSSCITSPKITASRVRNIRRDANEAVKKLLKDKLISEDDERRAHDEIQKLTDAYIAKIDQLSKAKEKDIMEVK